jgi:hypothetical protein
MLLRLILKFVIYLNRGTIGFCATLMMYIIGLYLSQKVHPVEPDLPHVLMRVAAMINPSCRRGRASVSTKPTILLSSLIATNMHMSFLIRMRQVLLEGIEFTTRRIQYSRVFEYAPLSCNLALLPDVT